MIDVYWVNIDFEGGEVVLVMYRNCCKGVKLYLRFVVCFLGGGGGFIFFYVLCCFERMDLVMIGY